MNISHRVKMKALELGYSEVGIAPCEDFPEYAEEILSRPGYEFAKMGADNMIDGCFPSEFCPWAKSMIVVTTGFGDIDFPDSLVKHVGRAYLARCYVPKRESMHARRADAFMEYLESLGMRVFQAGSADAKYLIPARMAAARAGVTTYGKNNFARTERDGTFIIISTFLVDKVLDYDEPTVEDPCPEGCTLCMDACPTGAIEEPCRLSPTKCILLNNLRGGGNPSLRPAIGEHIHGCDVCQEVCPRNQHVLKNATRKDPFLEALADEFDLERILLMDDEYYRDVVYPIMYNYITDFDVFRANAAVALGNSGDASHIPALRRAIAEYPDSRAAECAAWAIERLQGTCSRHKA